MRKIFKSLLLISVLLIILTLLPVLAHAQIAADPGCDPQDPGCPIDGGLSLLLAAGVGYGLKKVRDTRKRQVYGSTGLD